MSKPTPFGGPNGHPNYSKNSEKCVTHKYVKGQAVVVEPCCYCGKGISGTPKFTVFLTSDAEIVEADESLPDFLGHHPVGSDCARVLKKAGLPVYAK